MDFATKFATDYEEEESLDVMKSKKTKKKKSKKSKKAQNEDRLKEITIANELEKTEVKIKKRKRRVRNEESSDEEDATTIVKRKNFKNATKVAEKRSHEAFSGNKQAKTESANEIVTPVIENNIEIEDDDEFLNKALEKARRLKRLQKMSKSSRDEKISEEINNANEAVNDKEVNVEAVKNIVFEADSILDFATSLRNKVRDVHTRAAAIKDQKKGVQFSTKKKDDEQKHKHLEGEGNTGNRDVDMVDLAKEIKNDTTRDDIELDANLAKPIGRGLGSVLGLLKSTGVVGGSKGGKEGASYILIIHIILYC